MPASETIPTNTTNSTLKANHASRFGTCESIEWQVIKGEVERKCVSTILPLNSILCMCVFVCEFKSLYVLCKEFCTSKTLNLMNNYVAT